MVACHVTLVASAAGIPAINWQTPLQVPPSPTLSSPQEGVFMSELIIDSFNSSHEGAYLCEASVENLAFSVENSLIININPNCMSTNYYLIVILLYLLLLCSISSTGCDVQG